MSLYAELESALVEHRAVCSTCTSWRMQYAEHCAVGKAFDVLITYFEERLPVPVCEWCGKLPCKEGCTRSPSSFDARQACGRCGCPVLMAPGIEPMCGPCRWR